MTTSQRRGPKQSQDMFFDKQTAVLSRLQTEQTNERRLVDVMRHNVAYQADHGVPALHGFVALKYTGFLPHAYA